MKNSATALLAVVAVLMAGCGRNDPAIDESQPAKAHDRASTAHERPPAVTSWPDANASAADRLEWNLRTLVAAYDRAGVKDARWDETARDALTAFAELRARGDANAASLVRDLVKITLAAGCTDPMVTYLGLRYVHGPPDSANADAAQAYRQVADALAQSQYAPIRKFYASLRAAQAWKAAHDRAEGSGRVYGPYRRTAFKELCLALQEADLPADEALDAAAELMDVVKENSTHGDEFLPTLVDYLGRRWPANARARWLRGKAQVALAWNRRGSGYAGTVPDEGWEAFGQHLDGAAVDLEESWKLDPSNAETAVEMMRVELGQGRGRPRMELWFERAMKADPACYDAAYQKVWYLQPKWHGSAAEAIAFGHECVQSKEWKGRVPLILWEAHRMLANDRASGLKDQHWLQPGVWSDVQASFERFFELNPDARGWRHDYALHAYKCRQFDKFLDLLPTMGWVRDSYFGGREAFDRMVAEAEKATGRKAEVPKDRESNPARN